MERFTCDWIFRQLVVLCDGKVVCGCADPYGERPLGHLSEKGLLQIWKSEGVRTIRKGLNAGYAPFCLPCGLKRPLAKNEAAPVLPLDLDILPRIFFEPTVLCNLSCRDAVCSRESGIKKTRTRPQFPYEEFERLMHEIGPHLGRLDLFNYGDPFCHPLAVEMVEHTKRHFPRIYLYTSTNGLMLDEGKSRRLVQAGLDEITFSVDGSDAKTYSRYRRGGDFERLLEIMRSFVRLRNETGREVPFINWRYILFRWNDSRLKMNRARSLAAQVGVDRLTWEITDHPANACSRKYRRGSKAWKHIYHEIWDTSQIGSAIPKRQYRAVIGPKEDLVRIPVGKELTLTKEVTNTGGAPWLHTSFSGRRLVRLGAQLYSRDYELISLDYARAFLPRAIHDGESAMVNIMLPPIAQAGAYRIKFDMVSEGVDWFENGGSPVHWIVLTVS